MNRLAHALIDELDDSALDTLAALLAPRLPTRRDPAASEGRWLTAAEAATYLGLSVNALHKLTAARMIPFEQEGPSCKLYFQRSELDAWREAGGARSGLGEA
jgi:excisionase family DNA binding protein